MSIRTFFFSSFFAALFRTSEAQINIPPSENFSIWTSSTKLTDPSRIDPLDPDNGVRSIMTTLSYPIPKESCSKHCSVPYMPPLTASVWNAGIGVPNGTLESFHINVCCEIKQSYIPDPSTLPLVIASPGLGGTRFGHNAQAQALADQGYAVLTIDHPFDAAIVEFPDQPPVIGYLEKAALGNSTSEPVQNLTLLELGVRVRVADVTLALNELEKRDIVSQLLPGAKGTFNTSRAAMYGHSYGGATSIVLLRNESRLLGGLNLDGSLWGMASTSGVITKPAVILGTDLHNSTNDATWSDAWPQLQGFRREFAVQQAGHLLYFDMPYLFNISGMQATPEFAGFFGELGAKRGKYAFDLVVSFVTAFMDYVFYGEESVLLERPETVFPEILEVQR